MVASLKLDAIGDHLRPYQRDPRRVLRMLHRVPQGHQARLLDSGGPWVARIKGRCPTFGLKREFVRPLRDYRNASSSGKSGIVLVYMLPEGVYEVHEWQSWTKERRYFVRSEQGCMVEMTVEEVQAWLP